MPDDRNRSRTRDRRPLRNSKRFRSGNSSCGRNCDCTEILISSNHEEFEQLATIAELPKCPPRPGTQTVEGTKVDLHEQHRDTEPTSPGIVRTPTIAS